MRDLLKYHTVTLYAGSYIIARPLKWDNYVVAKMQHMYIPNRIPH